MNHHLTTKNKATGKAESIKQHELTQTGWGFNFLVDAELDAYKAAYIYRYSEHGVKVNYAPGVKMWLVTVFNQNAVDMGLDGAK